MASIPILIFPPSIARAFRPLIPYARALVSPKLRSDLHAAQLTGEPESYVIAFAISSLVWAFLLAAIMFFALYEIQLKELGDSLLLSAIPFVLFFGVFFILHMLYPSIIAQKLGELTDRKLIHMLRDMWVQSTSGVLLYDILKNVSEGDYGVVSDDLRTAVREISAGERDIVVLEKISTTTRSEAFKRAIWHMTASMRTGVSISIALDSVLSAMTAERYRAVKEYSVMLNFYLLLYLLFAAVVPALTTFLALISIFGIFTVSFELLIAVVVLSILFQIILIGFMRVGRPEVG